FFFNDPAPTERYPLSLHDALPIFRETIARVFREHRYVLDPHTAAAWKVADEQIGNLPRLVVGTAHPAKFSDVVTDAIGESPGIPASLARLADLPERHRIIDPTPEALFEALG